MQELKGARVLGKKAARAARAAEKLAAQMEGREWQGYEWNRYWAAAATGREDADWAAMEAIRYAYLPDENDSERDARCCRLLRCIFGNPFHALTIERSWRATTVTALAQAIYKDRAFDRMPILADALEDAGCSSQDILQHCRSGGEHVRGCWVVDLLLGKE